MSEKTIAGLENSGTDVQLNKVLFKSYFTSPADSDTKCQVCGKTIAEGKSVTLYLSLAPSRIGYMIGQCRCADHYEDLSILFTLGVRELIIDGRIGQHQDPTTQTRPVLLSPSIRLISTGDTTTGRVLPDADEPDTQWTHGEQLQDRLPTTQTELTVEAGQ